jgi:uncharacterized integral membrane protein
VKIKTTGIIILAILIVIFTLQNTEIITVKLWFWHIETSKALLIVTTVAAGTVFGMLLPSIRKGIIARNKPIESENIKND